MTANRSTIGDRNDSGDRDERGRFTKGNRAGVGHGPPRMAIRERLLRRLPEDAIDQVGERLYELAVSGDVNACRLLLERCGGKPRTEQTRIQLDLGAIESAGDCAKASAKVASAVAAGELDPSDAQQVAAVLEVARRSFELSDIEARLGGLEHKLGINPDG